MMPPDSDVLLRDSVQMKTLLQKAMEYCEMPRLGLTLSMQMAQKKKA